ncbi:MAG: hypothetical protein PHR68_01060 [Candidatus Gracilibacteria bacterium]|nr:hypothetical protein [Candidatus Gracilibacteria bacterium]
MNNNILKSKKNTKILSYFIIILSFLFLIIVTKNTYYDIQVISDENVSVKTDLDKKQENLKKLNDVKAALTSSGELANSLNRFTQEFSEQSIIDYFYTYSYNPNSGVIINNISLDKGFKNEYGFLQGNVSLSVTMKDEASMQAFISFINSPNSKFNFVLTNFSYPYGTLNKDFQVTFPLKVLYY